MPDLNFLNDFKSLHAQVLGSPSKGWFKLCGPFTDCPDNAPHWLPLVLFAGFVALVFFLSRRIKSKGNYRRVTRGPKPPTSFTKAEPGANGTAKGDEEP